MEVYCACTYRLDVPRSLKGGMANCPSCGEIVHVPGGPEPLFWVLLGGGILFVLGVSALLFAGVGVVAGLVSLGIGGAIIAIAVLCS